jgi:hypothetical protein
MKRPLHILSALLLLLLPATVQAAADVSIQPVDIGFSQPVLVAGDQVRIYAKIYNVGDEDVSGYVTFYQGATLIGDSQVVSLPANGNADEVYVDFVVPDRSFNILALIQGTDPSDVNSSNDTALTSFFDPVVDDDRDGIPNAEDTCPTVSNSDQRDTDGDGEGDACDSDDDNDRLSDDVEIELNTNPTQSDTDGDGVDDVNDAFPNDTEKAVVEAETVGPPQTEAFQKIVEEVARALQETTLTETQVDGDAIKARTDEIVFSPNAVFVYTQDDWNVFTFTVFTHAFDQTVSLWDFGDGVTSSKSTVQHRYSSSGAFPVTLTLTDQNGVVSRETTTVNVPLFHLKNRLVLASVILLLCLLLIGVVAFARLGRKRT